MKAFKAFGQMGQFEPLQMPDLSKMLHIVIIATNQSLAEFGSATTEFPNTAMIFFHAMKPKDCKGG